MLDLRLLHQALTLAHHRSFARAAEALHVTQPALSRSIAGLEASVGEKLFNRTTRGVEPTALGGMLLARARTLLDESKEIERDFTLMRGLEIGELRVGMGVYPAEMIVGRAVGSLMKRHPKLRIELLQTDLRALVEAVLARTLDLAVIELTMLDEDPRIATEPLPRHRGFFFCRAGHPLTKLKRPTLDDILAFPFVGTRLPKRVADAFFRSAQGGTADQVSGDYLPPIKVDSVRVARDVVLESDAVGVTPLGLIAEDIDAGRLVALPLQLPWMHTAYGFAYLSDRELSPAAHAFMAQVRSVEAELVAAEQAAEPARLHARSRAAA